MASNEGQVLASKQSAEDYWLECVKKWYPELHSRTYFLPPLHFNRVPYSEENIGGKKVLVAKTAQGENSGSRKRKYQTRSTSSQGYNPGSKKRCQQNKDNKLPLPVYESDVRDDRALERVLHCLRALADNSQPKEVMVVVSQLQFGNYLGKPCYAATAALLPRPNTLPQHFRHYDEGYFDVLIIHRYHGLLTLEIKSGGENFSQLEMTEQEKENVVMKKMKQAVAQLNKAEIVLKHLTSDMTTTVNVTKILAMPNITSSQLLRAISGYPDGHEDKQVLCRCLGVQSVDKAVKLCLLSDQLSDIGTLSDVNHTVLHLIPWWRRVVRSSGPQVLLTSATYEQVVARFCGPATTVEIHCITAPHLEIRIPGEAVSETGERVAKIVLFPQQVELLNRSLPLVFLSGPPGTGKTIVLILQGLRWVEREYDVHVVSTCYESLAATFVIEHQLQETMRTTSVSSRVYRHQFDFEKDGQVETAVKRLADRNEGIQLCVIADEAVRNLGDKRKPFTNFCERLIEQIPVVYLWGASVHHERRPLCLEGVKLTIPLRSPPVVMREVTKAFGMHENTQVFDYTASDVPVPTQGPAIMRFSHREGHSGHTEMWPRDCVECGHEVARILKELNVGMKGNDNGTPPLQYRDVMVLCYDYPTDDLVDSNGQVTRMASGLVRGLRECGVPVRVVKEGDEAAVRDTALSVWDAVTMTDWEDVQGLERKVIIVQNTEYYWSGRLYAMSRCTSQLVLIENKDEEDEEEDLDSYSRKCDSIDVHGVDDAMKLCLLSDQLSDK